MISGCKCQCLEFMVGVVAARWFRSQSLGLWDVQGLGFRLINGSVQGILGARRLRMR